MRWKKITLPDDSSESAWPLVRYRLEKKYGMQEVVSEAHPAPTRKHPKNRHSNSCFSAVLYTEFAIHHNNFNACQLLPENFVCETAVKIVLKHQLIPFPLRPYCPRKYDTRHLQLQNTRTVQKQQQYEEFATMTSEEERIEAVVDSHATRHKQLFYDSSVQFQTNNMDGLHHPSTYKTGPLGPIPHEGYVCFACLEKEDHFRECCPLPASKAVDKQRLATGIPTNFLKPTPTDVANSNSLPLATRLVNADGCAVHDTRQLYNCDEPHVETQARECSFERVLASLAATCTNSIQQKKLPKLKTVDASSIELLDAIHGGTLDIVLEIDTLVDLAERETKRYQSKFYTQHPTFKTKSSTVCQYYLRGLCHKSALTCQYKHHIDTTPMPVCQFFIKDQCMRGSCQFLHSNPARMQVQQCLDYVLGFCKQGASCPKSHIRSNAPPTFDTVRHWSKTTPPQFVFGNGCSYFQPPSKQLWTKETYNVFQLHVRALCSTNEQINK